MMQTFRVQTCGINYWFVVVGMYGTEDYLCPDGKIKNWHTDKLKDGDVQFPDEYLANKAIKEYEERRADEW